jgi:hypothetical protein
MLGIRKGFLRFSPCSAQFYLENPSFFISQTRPDRFWKAGCIRLSIDKGLPQKVVFRKSGQPEKFFFVL